MREWMASDLSKLDLLVVQIDSIHMAGELVLVAAIGIAGNGVKHPLGLVEGATENAAVVQALIDNLIERGLDPTVCRLFIIDGAKALSKVIRRTFGAHTPQRCQIRRWRRTWRRPSAQERGIIFVRNTPLPRQVYQNTIAAAHVYQREGIGGLSGGPT